MRLRLPYPEAKFKHLDDMEWSDILLQDHRGERRAVQEKWLEHEPRLIAFAGKWDPGMTVAQHGHMSTNTIYVVDGSITVGDVACTPGMNITLDVGTPYGPITAGQGGVTVYEVMGGDSYVWYADPEGFAALKRERGIRMLPNPALEGVGARAAYDDQGMLIAPQTPRAKDGYPKPRFRHADQVEWREVLAQDHGGKRVSAWEKALDLSPQVMCVEARLDPGMIIPARGRNCVTTVLVLDGSMTVGGRDCTKGMHITLGVGVPMELTIAGPEGVRLYEVRLGDPTSWFLDREALEALPREHGVTNLPVAPLELPAWLGQRTIYPEATAARGSGEPRV